MNAKPKRRKAYFVDRTVQGAILFRIATHWVMFLVAISVLLFFIELLGGDPRTAGQTMVFRHMPTLLAILVLTPILIRDLCKLTNRFAGPMVRLRRAIRDLAEGREVSPIQFREDDFWKDLADDFNQMVARIEFRKTDFPASHDEASSTEQAAENA